MQFITTAIICSFPEHCLPLQLQFTTLPSFGSSCWGIWGGIQNSPAAVAFSVSGGCWAAFPVLQVVSSPAICAMQPSRRAWTACFHSSPFNSIPSARPEFPCQPLHDEAARVRDAHPTGETVGAVYPGEDFITPTVEKFLRGKSIHGDANSPSSPPKINPFSLHKAPATYL